MESPGEQSGLKKNVQQDTCHLISPLVLLNSDKDNIAEKMINYPCKLRGEQYLFLYFPCESRPSVKTYML